GRKRMRHADLGLSELKDNVDTLIVIPNQKLLSIAGERTPLLETFKRADEVLLHAVQGISDLINIRGLINLDFADIRTVMANQGMALMGTGRATGENRAIEAATNAISSPLLENVSIDGAMGIIINVTGGPDLSLYEVNEASTLITEAAHLDAEIIFGAVIDDTLTDEIRVTVIATGFENRSAQSAVDSDMSSIQRAMAQSQSINYQVPSMQFQPEPMMPHQMPGQNPIASQPTMPEFTVERPLPPVRPQMTVSEFETNEMQKVAPNLPPIPTVQAPAPKSPQVEEASLPRDKLLAKARAYREQQTRGVPTETAAGEQLALDVDLNKDVNDSAKKLVDELMRGPVDSDKLDVPAYIRRQQSLDK
ncbi:MAG: cell division protein FtsZ, partial [Bdellovibrionales bacterium]|nr:cell division protein FtsZ [Bdellovibrionales bacterium]